MLQRIFEEPRCEMCPSMFRAELSSRVVWKFFGLHVGLSDNSVTNSIPKRPVGQTYSADIVAPPEVVGWQIEGVTVMRSRRPVGR